MRIFPIAEALALGACTAATVTALLAEAALRPHSQFFGRTLLAGRNPREIALTYDDGPNDAATPELLDLFAEHNVRATFFVIGKFVLLQPELTRRIHAEGHVVANHTMTHPNLAYQNAARVREELHACNAAIEDTLGAPVRFFRPPHGARRPSVFRTARELGLAIVQWNAMGYDWEARTPEAIAASIRGGMRRAERKGCGANILLHDGFDRRMSYDRSASVAATRLLLAEGLAAGRRFVAVDEWLPAASQTTQPTLAHSA